ncbi:MAG: carbohydrate kinase family protein [bacterium]
MKDVIAIGSVTRDVFLKTEFDLLPYKETPTGKALCIPLGEKFGVPHATFTIGGNAANASITFARQEFDTAIVTKVGDDAAGKEVFRVLEKEQIDTRFISLSNKPTNYSVLLLQNGERTILSYHGALDTFSTQDFSMTDLKSKWWYISLTSTSCTMFSRLMQFARKEGISVAMNPGLYHIEHGKTDIIKALPFVKFLVLNELEASKLTGIPFEKEAKLFAKLDELVPGIVAVTRGDKGVTVSDGHLIYRAGVFKVRNATDRTGAGDAFGSGFVAGLMCRKEKCIKGVCEPNNIEYALRLASANAASVVEHIGTSTGILTKSQFEKSRRFKEFSIQKEKA